MAIAQMNWGQMRHSLTDPRMQEFADALEGVYQDAENASGFIWRLPDADAEQQLAELGRGSLISATVSVWTDVAALKDYTFASRHGEFMKRSKEWFEPVQGPQLVIWDVDLAARPTFHDAFERLDHLTRNGPSEKAYGWPF